jgi:hypothetical protein
MLATFGACFAISFKSNKIKAIVAFTCIAVIIGTMVVSLIGFKNVTENSHVVANNVAMGSNRRDIFYDEAEDAYFYTTAHKWRVFFPQYRVYLDYDITKAYVDKYSELKEFDIQSATQVPQ